MKNLFVVAALLSASITVTACATGPETTIAAAPDFSPIATQPHPRARLFVDCIAQATANGTYEHAESDGNVRLLFTCKGTPARAFYDGLAVRSAAIGSEVQVNGRTLRTTERVERDMFGVDYCSTDGTDDFTCVINLNTGAALLE